MDQPRSKSEHIFALAKELLDDIELSRLPAEALLLKATRLARLVGSTKVRRWLEFEMVGYNAEDPVALEYMGHTGRWTDRGQNLGYWGPLAQQDASIVALKLRLQTLRVPDISYSISSANPNEWVTVGAGPPTDAVTSVVNESRSLTSAISQMSAVRSRVLALLHSFAAGVYYEKAFSGLAESIFERYKVAVDILLAERCGDVLEKVPAVYDRLAEGDQEAVSQALNTCRRVIDSFADAIYPPSEATIEIEGQPVRLGPQQHLNRVNAYIRERVSSESRRKRLRQSLTNVYDRVSSGVHKDITPEEARSLFLETYILLGEILTLSEPPAPPVEEPRSNPNEAIDTGT